jgi:hypothetical protein
LTRIMIAQERREPPRLVNQAPALIYFQEIRSDDIAKYKKQSNIAPTGGGARDLRIPQQFGRIIERFFPHAIRKSGVRQGTIHWKDRTSTLDATITLWPPTNARPNERRIAQISKIGAWSVDESRWKADLAKGKRSFFLLVKHKDGTVWARLLYESNLAQEGPSISRYIQKRIQSKTGNSSIRGSINFETEEEFP